MLFRAEYGGGITIAHLPHWEDYDETEARALFNAGYFEADTWEEVVAQLEKEGFAKTTPESQEHFDDLYPEGSSRDRRLVMEHCNFGLLLKELTKIERAYCYPYRMVPCDKCDGEGRHLYGSMRGYAFTEQDRWEMGEDDWNDMMSGKYDEQCGKCNGSGQVRRAGLPAQMFEVNHDSIRYTQWVKEHRPVCPHGTAPKKNTYQGRKVFNEKTVYGTHENCIPLRGDIPKWAVDLYHKANRVERENEAQARMDRETMWGEMGVPYHERY